MELSSVVVSFVVRENESAISVDPASAPPKPQLLPLLKSVSHVPKPPPKLELLVSAPPKLRSILGASSLRLISSNVVVPFVLSSYGKRISEFHNN